MSPGVYQITAEDILRGGETLHSEIKTCYAHLEQGRIASTVERDNCRTYSQK
jgi:hypothetical protein